MTITPEEGLPSLEESVVMSSTDEHNLSDGLGLGFNIYSGLVSAYFTLRERYYGLKATALEKVNHWACDKNEEIENKLKQLESGKSDSKASNSTNVDNPL